MASPVIDFHIHMIWSTASTKSFDELMDISFPDRASYEQARQRFADPAQFVALLKESGVDYGVILSEYAPLATGYTLHETVAQFCEGHEELIPFCSINPYLHPRPGELLKELCRNHGFRGLKLLPTYNYFYPNEPMLYPLYAAAQELGIPVLAHTGSSILHNARIKYGNPLFFDDVAVDFPDLTILMAHGGRGMWYDEAMTMVRLHKNVYIDLTGLPVRKIPGFFPDIDRFSDKFVFGTDWPQVGHAETIAKYSKIGLSEESRQKILGGNAARILGIEAS